MPGEAGIAVMSHVGYGDGTEGMPRAEIELLLEE